MSAEPESPIDSAPFSVQTQEDLLPSEPEQPINLEPLAVASQPPADNRDARLPSSIKTSEDFFDIDQISPTQKYKDLRGFSVDMSAVQNAISSPVTLSDSDLEIQDKCSK